MFAVHPTVISHGKRQLLEGAAGVVRAGRNGKEPTEEERTAPL